MLERVLSLALCKKVILSVVNDLMAEKANYNQKLYVNGDVSAVIAEELVRV
tara:strand:+ start:358 stop:510 length:153 start_codon:yes stop_codon:yes gene_type:complete